MKLLALLASLLLAWQSQDNQAKIDSLATIASSTVYDTAKVDAFVEITRLYSEEINPEKFKLFADQTLALAEEIGYNWGLVKILYLKAYNLNRIGEYVEAFQACDRLQKISSAEGFTLYEGLAVNLKGVIYDRKGRINESQEFLQKAAELYASIPDKLRQAYAINALGYSYKKMAEIHGDTSYLRIAYAKIKEANDLGQELGEIVLVANSEVAMGDIYLKRKQFNLALHHYQKALGVAGKNKFQVIDAYGAIGLLYLEAGQFDSSKLYLNKAIVESQKNNFVPYLAESSINLSKVFISQGDFSTALLLLDSSEHKVKGLGSWSLLKEVLESKIMIYDALNDFEKAFQTTRELKVVNDTINKIANRDQIASLQFEHDIAEANMKLTRLEEENEFQKKLKLVIIAGAIPAFLLASILIILLIRRNRKNKQLLEAKYKLHEMEINNTSLRENNLKANLELRNKELTAQALNLVSKENILRELKESLKNLKENTKDPEALNKILIQIELSQNREKDWEDFRNYYQQVNAGFFESLNARISDLSQADIRLSALLRLNLTTKQCADILGISPESVKMARYRLRKKLQLASDENLVTFLISLN